MARFRRAGGARQQIIHPYGDFLLHDIEIGDGIVQAGRQNTANKLRTAPLWGLRMRPRFMHDLQSLTLERMLAFIVATLLVPALRQVVPAKAPAADAH